MYRHTYPYFSLPHRLPAQTSPVVPPDYPLWYYSGSVVAGLFEEEIAYSGPEEFYKEEFYAEGFLDVLYIVVDGSCLVVQKSLAFFGVHPVGGKVFHGKGFLGEGPYANTF